MTLQCLKVLTFVYLSYFLPFWGKHASIFLMLLLCSYLLQEFSDSLPEIYSSYPLRHSQVSPLERSLPWPLWLGQIYVVFLKHLGFFPSWFMSPLPFHFNFHAPLIYLPLSTLYSVREGIMLVFAHHQVSASCLVLDRFSVLNKYLLINASMKISGNKNKNKNLICK